MFGNLNVVESGRRGSGDSKASAYKHVRTMEMALGFTFPTAVVRNLMARRIVELNGDDQQIELSISNREVGSMRSTEANGKKGYDTESLKGTVMAQRKRFAEILQSDNPEAAYAEDGSFDVYLYNQTDGNGKPLTAPDGRVCKVANKGTDTVQFIILRDCTDEEIEQGLALLKRCQETIESDEFEYTAA